MWTPTTIFLGNLQICKFNILNILTIIWINSKINISFNQVANSANIILLTYVYSNSWEFQFKFGILNNDIIWDLSYTWSESIMFVTHKILAFRLQTQTKSNIIQLLLVTAKNPRKNVDLILHHQIVFKSTQASVQSTCLELFLTSSTSWWVNK